MGVTDPKFNPSGNSGINDLKVKANELAALIEAVCPAGRRRSIALTHLETASMFAVKSCAVGDE
ncbi:MAG: hypothetical protein AAFQ17_01240 [Pseudomonadota bacterium]